MTQKKKRVVKYKLIESDILQKIKNGDYNKGQLIETEQELSNQYNVSRVTVRQATNNLVAKGYLSRSQGSGTYVTNVDVVGRTAKSKSFTEEMQELGKEVSTKILDFKIIKATKEIYRKLEIEEGKPVYFIKRLREADNEPLVLEYNYMNVEDYPDLSFERMTGSKYQYIEDKGLTIDHSHHMVVPIMPTEEIAEIFQCDIELPLLKVFNTTYLTTGKVMDYTELILNTEKYQYQSYRSK